MILLSSNANNIFWLGRYLTRIQYFCNKLPFTDDQKAIDFSHAFCLPAYDAASLNTLALDPEQQFSLMSQFAVARDNIHELRAVLSANTYAEMIQLVKNASSQPGYICDVVSECNELLESESEDVFLFFSLGQKLELLDSLIRFKQDPSVVLNEIDVIVGLLNELGWTALDDAWISLKQSPDTMSLYHFGDQLQLMFEGTA
ncbi:alpha-E domain-containing protein [Acinetobacter soli]|uniref:alpha-E domain-containing protein n=1 Tax=Acinetobacter soli TaxID=487316 RepID=UPI001D0BB923|nr:alpha-E domain-containing protein [Acinetobacter soli]MCB8767481.1 alpha-E domain-containing protein [Acinetobacter soli]